MEIRRFTTVDRVTVSRMMDEFYHSEAVCHTVPTAYFERTLDAVQGGTPFADCFVLEEGDSLIGYALTAVTWSNEAGGKTVWLEELYLAPSSRGKGYGTSLIHFLHRQYADAKRFRLEVTPKNERVIQLYYQMGYDALPYDQMFKE